MVNDIFACMTSSYESTSLVDDWLGMFLEASTLSGRIMAHVTSRHAFRTCLEGGKFAVRNWWFSPCLYVEPSIPICFSVEICVVSLPTYRIVIGLPMSTGCYLNAKSELQHSHARGGSLSLSHLFVLLFKQNYDSDRGSWQIFYQVPGCHRPGAMHCSYSEIATCLRAGHALTTWNPQGLGRPKFVVMLRDPVKRLISEFFWGRSNWSVTDLLLRFSMENPGQHVLFRWFLNNEAPNNIFCLLGVSTIYLVITEAFIADPNAHQANQTWSQYDSLSPSAPSWCISTSICRKTKTKRCLTDSFQSHMPAQTATSTSCKMELIKAPQVFRSSPVVCDWVVVEFQLYLTLSCLVFDWAGALVSKSRKHGLQAFVK